MKEGEGGGEQQGRGLGGEGCMGEPMEGRGGVLSVSGLCFVLLPSCSLPA
jgi:hypothetical protein